ncbi:type II secretion system protein M [Corticibacter populi]|uniref:Type II secretion system protein M n=1 Tax=Corticibacter populi TaxID=1550736 RepID=A0A3M6QIU1_9BURK|nr:type II secretion system protein GspM [Corticibacter populi]RMX02996.1 type II secretion system protein M [Corticibacter populi]RZS33425.1 general secretion pathway protein M [Corticibacter populi]
MSVRTQIRQQWQGMQPRERRLVAGAVLVVLAALVWWLALAPALQTARGFDAASRALDTQVQQMQRLRQQALQYREQTSNVSPAAAGRHIQAATTRLLGDAAQLTTVGEQSTVRLQNVPAPALQAWLQEVREGARSQPVQVDIRHAPGGDGAPLVWSGTVVLALPAAAP